MTTMYCVCYRYSDTTEVHRGSPISYEDAHAWVRHLNAKYSDMRHWLEKV